jgi:heme-degrading monooxygenase HmoA
VEELARAFEQSGEAVRELDGFEGAYLLFDPETGRAMTVALWSDADAAESSAERIGRLREEAAESVGHRVTAVETYEVPAQLRR